MIRKAIIRNQARKESYLRERLKKRQTQETKRNIRSQSKWLKEKGWIVVNQTVLN